jgi:hypothetical protein
MAFPWNREIREEVRFENLDDYPQLSFYLVYARGQVPPQAPLRVIPVTSREPIALEGQKWIPVLVLVAVPKGHPAPPVAGLNQEGWEEWLEGEGAGILRSPRLLPAGGQTTVFDPSDRVVTPYRVNVKNGQILVEKLPEERSLNVWRTVILGLCLSLVLIVVGLWYVRRTRKKAALQSPSAPPLPGSSLGSPS